MPRKRSKDAEKGQPTEKLSVCLSRETKKALVEDSYKKFGKRKGAISMNLESILRIQYSMTIKGVTET